MYEINTETNCWIWQGPTCSSGRYGRVPKTKPMVMAHRQSYELHNGPIPNGLLIRHSCDNGLCVNPAHLSIGTVKDNAQDCLQRGRQKNFSLTDQTGEQNANAKYTKEFAEEIRNYYVNNKCSYQALADKFGLKSKGHAYNIIQRKIWI